MSVRHLEADAVAVLDMGLCTPLGLTALATQVEMAAGTVRFFETDVLDNVGEPVRASVLTLLEPDLTRTERMTAMAVTALQESLKHTVSLGIARLPLLLALPELGSGSPFERDHLLDALSKAMDPIRLEVSESTLFPEGRAGLFRALAAASQHLKSRKSPFVLVGGVDSTCDRASLTHHARTGRCLGPGTRDGLLPGEGAGFFLLASNVPPGLSAHGWIIGCALAHEPNAFQQQESNLAKGLTAAFRQLRQHPIAGTRRVDHLLSCQTGETFWTQEFNHAYFRNAPLMPEPLTVDLVAEHLGDIGAAAGAVQLGNALHRFKRLKSAHGRAARALIYGCADAGQVGACILEERK